MRGKLKGIESDVPGAAGDGCYIIYLLANKGTPRMITFCSGFPMLPNIMVAAEYHSVAIFWMGFNVTSKSQIADYLIF